MTKPHDSPQRRSASKDQALLGRLTIGEATDGPVVVKHWFTKNTVRFSICAVIASFMLVYPPDGFVQKEFTHKTALFIALAVFAAFASYYSLAGWLNKTLVFADADGIRVRHGPIPWRGNKDIGARNLKGLFCRRKAHKRIALFGSTQTETFEIYAHMEPGKPSIIIKGIETEEQADAAIDALRAH